MVFEFPSTLRRKSAPHLVTIPAIDAFERLPDPLLVLIFNKLCDVKALGRCCAVSKRFNTLIPQAEDVIVKIDCVVSADETSRRSCKTTGILSNWLRIVLGSLVRPLHVLQQYWTHKKPVFAEISRHSPADVLKNFTDVRHLKIELPGGELGIGEGVLLRWKAEFGSTLESCVILYASSLVNFDKQMGSRSNKGYLRRIEDVPTVDAEETAELASSSRDGTGNIPEAFYTNGGLKLRVVWTISSLIAASARHYLLQQIISDHPTLESLVLSDADGQGTLCMGKEQIRDFRDNPITASASSKRTQVPALNIKLWHAPFLDLPSGSGMNGATLVAIRPNNKLAGKDAEMLVSNAFEEPFRSAASSLVGRRTYFLEMNSF